MHGSVSLGLVEEFVDKLGPVLDRTSTRVLDVGCGEGFMACLLCGKVAGLTAVDVSADAIEKIGARGRGQNIDNISIVHGDIFSVATRDKFDLVTFFLSLHHIADPDSVVRRCRDLSHPGTKIAIAEIVPGKTPFHRHDSVPYDGLEPDFIEKIFRDNGFAVSLRAPLPSISRPGGSDVSDGNNIPNDHSVYMVLFEPASRG